MQRYPEFLPERMHYSFLSLLNGIQAQSKKAEVSRWIQRCLRHMAECQYARSCVTFTVDSREQCEPVWKKVWASTLR